MTDSEPSPAPRRHPALPERRCLAFALASLFLLLAVIYANSITGGWQFDDGPNIVANANVHLQSLSRQTIVKALYVNTFATGGDRLTRPLAYLSFAANYYLGGLDVRGYHLFNIVIHYIAAVFLFLTIERTLNLPLLREETGNRAYPTALLATFFWASSPLQVNAVTYVVQRMTSMAGMFTIMALYFYVRGRTADRFAVRPYILSAVCAVLSLATKPIAAVLPVSIFLYDLLLIQGVSRENLRRAMRIIIPAVAAGLIILVGTVVFTALFDYSRWTFTMKERLLTEPRVMLFYLTLLLYPAGSRLMMDYDIELSHSLFSPWTTLPAMLAVVGIVGCGLWLSRKKPLIAFSILFFFLNHLIEGSFIPLDIAFDYRNYVPSFFFFLPPALFLIRLLDSAASRRAVRPLLAFGIILLLVAQARIVALRNDVFQDAKVLWADNVSKAPLLSRPHAILGGLLYEAGNYAGAIRETEKALALARYSNVTQPALYRTNLGLAYLSSPGGDDRAVVEFARAIRIQPNLAAARNGMALAMLRRGLLAEAYANSEKAVQYDPGNANYRANLALVLLKSGNPDRAVEVAREALSLKSGFNKPLSVIAEAYRLTGDYGKAIIAWGKFRAQEPNHIGANLALLELYSLKNNKALLTKTAGRLMLLAAGRDILDLEIFRTCTEAAYVPERKKIAAILKPLYRELGEGRYSPPRSEPCP